jgi:hypothetical membrane protein
VRPATRSKFNPGGLILNGMLGVALAWVLWVLTTSFIGWAILFLPGTALILIGVAIAVWGV